MVKVLQDKPVIQVSPETQARVAPRVTEECPGRQAQQVQLEPQGQQGKLVNLVIMAILDNKVLWGQPVHLEPLDKTETWEGQDSQELKDQGDPRVWLELLDPQVYQVA